MVKRSSLVLACLMLVVGVGVAQQRGAPRGNAQPPDIVGAWTGTWATYNPAQGAVPPRTVCAKLDATIVAKGDIFEATFEGDCGRPYKYSIKMEGRAVGGSVLFKGTVDLGAQDGGVYDWVGRATAREFNGFYTSAASTGVFTMARAPVQGDVPPVPPATPGTSR